MSYMVDELKDADIESPDPFAVFKERAQALYDETAQKLAEVRAENAASDDVASEQESTHDAFLHETGF